MLEECCESGKKLMKEEKIEHASLIDFHYCQGAFGTSLEEIRKEEETEDSSRPWFLNCIGGQHKAGKAELINGKYVSCEVVQMKQEMLNRAGRSNIRILRSVQRECGRL